MPHIERIVHSSAAYRESVEALLDAGYAVCSSSPHSTTLKKGGDHATGHILAFFLAPLIGNLLWWAMADDEFVTVRLRRFISMVTPG